MSVKERIKKFAKSQERSIVAFEKKSGLNIGYINAIRVSIQPEKIQSIASNYPNLNIDWLLTGVGEMLKSGDKNEAIEVSSNYKPTTNNTNQVNSEEMYLKIINELKEENDKLKEELNQLKGQNSLMKTMLNIPGTESDKKVSLR